MKVLRIFFVYFMVLLPFDVYAKDYCLSVQGICQSSNYPGDFMFALSANAYQLNSSQQIDDSAKKKSEAMKAIIQAGIGLHNVTVDHIGEAITKIASDINSNEKLLYRPDNNAPSDFISYYEEHLFTHINWIMIEERLMSKYEDEYVNILMKNYNVSDKDYKKRKQEMTSLAQKIIERFTIPNFRSIYLNWIYFQGFKKEDLTLVIDGLSGN